MSTTIDLRELPARLEEALALVTSGREVLLMDGTIPRAWLVPSSGAGPRVPGLHAGALQAAPDLDAPLPDDFWTGQQ
jgi:antitoxin (DNA-binding transcriptional repressor) of toxin-antitoxin stability system